MSTSRDSLSLILGFLGYVFWVFPRAPPRGGEGEGDPWGLALDEPSIPSGTGQPWPAAWAHLPSDAGL